jgi:hypothetical protein
MLLGHWLSTAIAWLKTIAIDCCFKNTGKVHSKTCSLLQALPGRHASFHSPYTFTLQMCICTDESYKDESEMTYNIDMAKKKEPKYDEWRNPSKEELKKMQKDKVKVPEITKDQFMRDLKKIARKLK